MEGIRLFGQIMALILVPVIIILGMALTTAWHAIIANFLSPLGAFGNFLTVFLSVAVFIAAIVFAYFWVKTQGFGLLAVSQ